MNKLKSLLLSIRIYYLSFLDYLDELRTSTAISLVKGDMQIIERKYQNDKLMRGVRKLVIRLRNMSPEARLAEENLLSKEPYKKTRKEVREELEARHRLLKNPLLETEDDLVRTVVRKAPIYVKEQELKEVRKAITACLKASSANPTDPSHIEEARRLKAKLSLLKSEVERLKQSV